MVTVRVSGRPARIVPETTLGVVVSRFGLRPHAGDLLAVNGTVLRARAFPGAYAVNGKPASMRTRLHGGDRIAAIPGSDHTEPLVRTVVPDPGGVP